MIEELKLARRSAGWSQDALAKQIGTDTQTIKRLERGVGSVPTLLAVMAALSFSLTGIGPGATLPEQLRDRRKRQSISLDAMARRTGLSRATIASIERGGGSVSKLVILMRALAPQARRRAPERAYWGQGDKADRDSRFTPPDFFAKIVAAFGSIDIDPCGHLLSPVVAERRILLSEGGDGLVDDWSGRLAFVNPPFSAAIEWLKRAHAQWRAGNVETVVCLVPVRTDSPWFHDVLSFDADIRLLRGRISFLDSAGKGQHTPFALMLSIMGATADQLQRCAEAVSGRWLYREEVPAFASTGIADEHKTEAAVTHVASTQPTPPRQPRTARRKRPVIPAGDADAAEPRRGIARRR